MNKIIALTVGLVVAGPTIISAINSTIGTPLTIVLLVFSLIAGFFIAKHDDIEEMETGWFGLKTFDNYLIQ